MTYMKMSQRDIVIQNISSTVNLKGKIIPLLTNTECMLVSMFQNYQIILQFS